MPDIKIKILTLIFLVALTSCSSTNIDKNPIDIRIAITGNTSPDSPFTGFTEKLPTVINMINEDNPIALIHTGNIIHGGMEWMGINQKDIERQFNEFNKLINKLNPIFHCVAGKKDLFNKNTEIYQKKMQRKLNYSFNYGNIHFIILNTLNLKFSTIQKYHFNWLKKDLEDHKHYSAVLVFTHTPIYKPGRAKLSKVNSKIHSMFKRYPVKAVFSGSYNKYYKINKNGIEYIIAGCNGFTKEKGSWYYNQYYIIDYKNGKFKITPRKLK